MKLPHCYDLRHLCYYADKFMIYSTMECIWGPVNVLYMKACRAMRTTVTTSTTVKRTFFSGSGRRETGPGTLFDPTALLALHLAVSPR
jgi:hypothetical protein